jgi:hypothetical protein
MRFDMKDTFIDYNLSEKINHFIFECEVFDEKDEIAQSRDIQIELADYELPLQS